MSDHGLVLCPVDPGFCVPGRAGVTTTMRDIGLLGDALGEPPDNRFRAGNAFLQLVTFLGCSPSVRLDASAAEPNAFCFVEIPEPANEPRFLGGTALRAIRCPHCRRSDPGWHGRLSASAFRHDAAWICPGCARQYRFLDLDWRRCAGFVRSCILIRGVYPHEALPSERLLNSLSRYCGCDWDYFYT